LEKWNQILMGFHLDWVVTTHVQFRIKHMYIEGNQRPLNAKNIEKCDLVMDYSKQIQFKTVFYPRVISVGAGILCSILD